MIIKTFVLAAAGCAHAVLANVSFLTDPGLARPSYEALDDIVRRTAALGQDHAADC